MLSRCSTQSLRTAWQVTQTAATNEDDDLDDDSYPILNKELRKQIFIFERELLKVEQLFMDIGDLLDSANEIINPESIKKTSVNQ